MTTFDIHKFLPAPWASDSGPSAIVSNVCIWIIIAFFTCALLIQGWKFFKLRENVRRGLDILNRYRPDQLAAARRDIDDQMDAIPIVGELWHEFDETLVSSRGGEKVYNTLDADHFFNTTTLGQGVTESRFISAVPGMLTAIGVFGTFVGLQFGLGSLNLTDSETMSTSMSPLIAGAATAFKTSVWGILTSFIFNVVEKVIEGSLINKIRTFQFRTDRLFDRTLGEQALLDIKVNTSESEKLLRVLGEQIGDKIQEGISSAIAPQMEKLANVMTNLADRQASGAESALRDLVQSFTAELGDAGRKQAESMENSAEALSVAMGQLDTTIATFLQRVGDQIEELNQVAVRNQAVNAKAQRRAEKFVADTEESNAQFSAVSEEVTNAGHALGVAVKDLEQVSKSFSHTIGSFASSQTKATNSFESASDALSGSTSALDEASQRIEHANKSISSSVGTLAETTIQANKALASLPEKHQAVLNQFFDDLTKNLSNYTSTLDKEMGEFSEKLVGSSNQRVEEWTTNTQIFCNNMKDAVEFLNGTINEMSTKSK